MSPLETIKKKYEALKPFLNERQRRLWSATEAQALGWGGITLVSQATGLKPTVIAQGLRDLKLNATDTFPPPSPAASPTSEALRFGAEQSGAPSGSGGERDSPESPEAGAEAIAVLLPGRLRRPGGGRKRLVDRDPTLLKALEALVEPLTRGEPDSPLRWTCKSTAKLAEALKAQGHPISQRQVGYLLHQLGYSLQANRKTEEGKSHPDRNAQFERINAQTEAFQARGQPVISVDTKKKELGGPFKNGGQEWQPQGQPVEVSVYDFPDKLLKKAIPYGVYDVTKNAGWVSVGCDHDTAEFAVASIRNWWKQMGQETYPKATELLIIADGGGSNGSRSRLWKREIQKLADAIGLTLRVGHFPPGMSKWNRIEHRMFCPITQNWRSRPLISHEVVVELIGSTTTQAGLAIQAARDVQRYPIGIVVTDDELAQVQIERDSFHGEWNYIIRPSLSPIP